MGNLKKFKYFNLSEDLEDGVVESYSIDRDISIMFVKKDDKIFDDTIYVAAHPMQPNVYHQQTSVASMIASFSDGELFGMALNGGWLPHLRKTTGLPFTEESDDVIDPNSKFYSFLLSNAQSIGARRDLNEYPSFPPINI
tara:strand:- start:81002 stop:81421 length:420 start_codon:yes stop_codon:yes gene_type:complete